ncbi:MAG: hypothetical protein KGL39_25630 [Patescibacteria group bacterium]|nr:hypothetical protein [Patescibacteria group bacterium]
MPETNDLHAIRETLAAMLSVFQSMAQSLQSLAERFKITGIEISPGTPKKENPLKVTLVKKSALKAASPKAQHGAAVVAFTLVDNETATATWNDGSIGPFKFTLPVNMVSGGATGIVIQPGIPTVS